MFICYSEGKASQAAKGIHQVQRSIEVDCNDVTEIEVDRGVE